MALLRCNEKINIKLENIRDDINEVHGSRMVRNDYFGGIFNGITFLVRIIILSIHYETLDCTYAIQ